MALEVRNVFAEKGYYVRKETVGSDLTPLGVDFNSIIRGVGGTDALSWLAMLGASTCCACRPFQLGLWEE